MNAYFTDAFQYVLTQLFSSIGIAFLSLLVALASVILMYRAQKLSKNQLSIIVNENINISKRFEASVIPSLTVHICTVEKDVPSPYVEISISNTGLGPAVLKDMDFYFKFENEYYDLSIDEHKEFISRKFLIGIEIDIYTKFVNQFLPPQLNKDVFIKFFPLDSGLSTYSLLEKVRSCLDYHIQYESVSGKDYTSTEKKNINNGI